MLNGQQARAGQVVAERERWTDHLSDAGHSAHWRRSSSLFDTTLSVIGMVFVSPFDVFTSQ